ncbi:MAG: RluA family pseudouridine synthase [Treponemataceae bacterium]
MPSMTLVVPADIKSGFRLDRFVAERLAVLTRSQIKARGLVARVNGKTVKISRVLLPNDRLEIEWNEVEPSELEVQNIPLDILYEDESAVVVNKAQGMVVHPGAGNRSGTLANALLYRRLERSGLIDANPGFRPGIVHRLDKDTSGVIIAAYDDKTLAFLADQFKARTTRKTYIAVVTGSPPEDRGLVSTLIARDRADRKRFTVSPALGKSAITQYRVLKRFKGYAFVVLHPKTGRTHQLRVHLRHLGCPILGDPIYGGKDPLFPKATLMLHAYRLALCLPGSETPSVFTAPVPERFRKVLRILRLKNR